MKKSINIIHGSTTQAGIRRLLAENPLKTSDQPGIIIYGPGGCGKTSHAEAIARKYGVTVVIDEWDGKSDIPNGALALTGISPDRLPKLITRHAPQCQVIQYYEAIKYKKK